MYGLPYLRISFKQKLLDYKACRVRRVSVKALVYKPIITLCMKKPKTRDVFYLMDENPIVLVNEKGQNSESIEHLANTNNMQENIFGKQLGCNIIKRSNIMSFCDQHKTGLEVLVDGYDLSHLHSEFVFFLQQV